MPIVHGWLIELGKTEQKHAVRAGAERVGEIQGDGVAKHGVAGTVKLGTPRVPDRDLKGLRAMRAEARMKRSIVVSLEPRPRQVDGIHILPWREFLARLWDNAL